MSQYNTVSQMPSHGNASEARVANAREGFQRGGMASAGRGMRGSGMGGSGPSDQPSCAFPAPAPARIYCTPAAFTDLYGRKYIPISQAYGNSVPAQAYY